MPGLKRTGFFPPGQSNAIVTSLELVTFTIGNTVTENSISILYKVL